MSQASHTSHTHTQRERVREREREVERERGKKRDKRRERESETLIHTDILDSVFLQGSTEQQHSVYFSGGGL